MLNCKLQKILILTLLLTGLFVFALPALAQNLNTGIDYGAYTGLVDTDPRIIIARIINVALGFLGVVALVLVLYGGFKYMTASGNEEEVAAAKKILLNAAIGLAIILSAYGITRFVISKLSDAIIGQAINNEVTPPCEGPDCPSGDGGEGLAFYATVVPREPVPIYNLGIAISFRKGGFGGPATVNRSTINSDNIKVYKIVSGQSDERYNSISAFEFASNDVVKFHSTGSCAPANPAASDCFEPNTTYKIVLSPNITEVSTAQPPPQLSCSGSYSCEFTVTTGNQYDASPPAIEMIQPGNTAILADKQPTDISVRYGDDVGVKQLAFFVSSSLSAKATIRSMDINPFERTGTTSTKWTPSLPNPNVPKIFDLFAEADDLDSHTAESAKQTVKVLPWFCFNHQLDAGTPAFETSEDCGGPVCGSCPGGGCNTNLDCAGGFCDPATHTCVARPKITNVELKDGAEGNYVTIFGKYFGNTPGQVVFLGGAGEGDDKMSASVNSQCTSNWHDNYIIVAVPTGAKTGPIEIKKAGATTANDRDKTNDSWGPDFANTVFLVNSEDRPGLCRATPALGAPTASVTVYGDELGASGVLSFGDFAAVTSNWNNQSINTTVPNLPAQVVSISVTLAGGQKSNDLPFTIGVPSEAVTPFIDQLTPTSSPIGTLITITGRNFGEATGVVEFQQGTTTKPAEPPPAGCPSAWSPTQIIVRVPPGLNLANAKVLVKTNGAGSLTSNQKDFLVNNDPIPPGLCALEPDNGPANTVVTLKGDGFGTNGLVRYWSGVQATTVSSWQNNQIISTVPAGAKTGAVVVKNTVNAVDSNPLTFKVQDCRVNPTLCTGGTSCCSTGSCASQCAQGPKASVYSWSFSTGRLPVVPRVLEECKTGVVPSPSPAFKSTALEKLPTDVCVNAVVKARFSSLVQGVNTGSVTVETCSDENCTPPTNFVTLATADLHLSLSNASLKEGYTGTAYDAVGYEPINNYLSPNTWYRVTFTTGISSLVFNPNTGVEQTVLERPLAENYVYKFKTRNSTEPCLLSSAIVSPDPFIARAFSKKYNFPPDDVDNPLYSVTAIDNNHLCWALNANNYDWTWNAGPSAGALSSPVYAEVTNDKQGDPLRGKPYQYLLTKDKETLPVGEKVWAKTGTIVDNALLYIKLTNPKILESWPNCQAACVNAEIGAKFNVNLTNPGVDINKVQLCENNGTGCATAGENLITGTTASSNGELGLSHGLLSPDKEYRVIIKGGANGIKSNQDIELDTASLNYNCSGSVDNQVCTDFSWTFRTKSDPNKCAVASVEVSPAEAIVYWVGAKAPVYGVPRGAIDACSPFGQRLDSWDYAWSWATVDTSVATVTNDNRGKPLASQTCSESCLHIGGRPAPKEASDGDSIRGALGINSWTLENGKYVGKNTVVSEKNNRVEVVESMNYDGQGFDQGNARGSSINASWTYNFSFPITTSTYKVYVVSSNYSEDLSGFSNEPNCTDPGIQHHLVFYLDGVNKGSVCNNATSSTLPKKSAYVDLGLVTAGQHDLKIVWDNDWVDQFPDPLHDSNVLLHRIGFVYGVIQSDFYCGDGATQTNLGEECDEGGNNGKPGSGCALNCLTTPKDRDLCGNGNPQSDNNEECDGGWCSSDCQNLGSNSNYGSVCGNGGNPETGEDCEPGNDTADALADPWQLSTAVGNGAVNAKKQQVTDIKATTENKTGLGKFILQCGYEPLDDSCPDNAPLATNGVGSDSCCYPRPVAVMLQPPFPSGSDNICPNTALVVRFDQKMDVNSLTPDTVLLGMVSTTIGTGGCVHVGQAVLPKPGNWWQKIVAFVKNFLDWPAQAVDYCANDISYTVSASSTFVGTVENTDVRLNLVKPLNFDTQYRIFIKGKDKTRNSKAVTMLDNFVFEFTTKSEICKINYITVVPETTLLQTTFPDPSDNNPNAGAGSDDQINDVDKIFSVKAYSKTKGVPDADVEITPYLTVYNWAYGWSNNNVAVASMAPVNTPNVLVTAIKNGLATLTTVATVDVDTSAPSDVGKEYKDTGLVQVFLCENPWPTATVRPVYGLGYVDVFEGDGPEYRRTNLKLMYCRDAGKVNDVSDDLPKLNMPFLISAADPIYKEFFLTFADPDGTNVKADRDSIGLRVYANNKHLSLLDWYYKERELTGSPVPVTVGSYEALQEGRTFYINGLNVNGGTIYSNVYVFSFSDNALSETLNIVNQLMANFALNLNIPSPRVCTGTTLACSKDLDCPAGVICQNDVDKMYRDFKRIKDLQLITNKLWDYHQKHENYPNLTENATLGTYLPSYTNSRWRSWQGVLGNLLSYNVPSDPLNEFSGCNSGLVSQWSAENNAKDSLSVNDGILSGGNASYENGRFGLAFKLNGPSHVEINNSSSLNPRKITVSAWVKKTSEANFQTIVGKYYYKPGDNQGSWLMDIATDKKLRCLMKINNAWVIVATDSNDILADVWQHVACTFDGAQVKSYVNGVAKSSFSASGDLSVSDLKIGIGQNTNNVIYQSGFVGLIDEVSIYNRALSASEIANLANGINYDPTTCWNSVDQTFVCPAGSHIYQYTTDGGSKVKLQSDFELSETAFKWGSINNAAELNATKPSGVGSTIEYQTSNSCNATVQGTSNRCGDGIVGIVNGVQEVCEIGQTHASDCTVGGYKGKLFEKCKSDCSGFEPDSAPGLIGWWKGEGNALNSSGSGEQNGVVNPLGGVTYVPGKQGRAFEFTAIGGAVGGYVVVPGNGYNLNYSTMTATAWVYKKGDDNWMRIMSREFYTGGSPPEDPDSTFLMDAVSVLGGQTNLLRCRIYTVNETLDVLTGTESLPKNKWTQVACTYDGYKATVYINGQKAAESSSSATSVNMKTGSLNLGLGVGTDNTHLQNSFIGLIDEAQLYSRALSPGEINNLYLGKNAGGCVPQGSCGDGKIQTDSVSAEQCDDGANNGKYGYCTKECKLPTQATPPAQSGGYCGNGQLDAGKEVCDESADVSCTNGNCTTYNYGWCSKHNMNYNGPGSIGECNKTASGDTCANMGDADVYGFASGYVGPCLKSGARYNREKEKSCSWDCQSRDYCGDGKVNSTYEECEKNESCQVGTCSNDAKVYCETDANCSSGGICQNKQPGKRYCHVPGEIMPDLDNVTTYLLFKDKKDSQGQYVKEVEGVNVICKWVRVGNSFSPFLMNTTCLPLKYEQTYSALNCGNGTLDVGEICDAGARNGQVCNNYSQAGTCTYCAYGCQQVITVQNVLNTRNP